MCPFCVPIYKKKDSVLEFQIRFVTIFFLYTIRIFMTYALIAVGQSCHPLRGGTILGTCSFDLLYTERSAKELSPLYRRCLILFTRRDHRQHGFVHLFLRAYFLLYFKNTKKPVYSQSTNPCKAILLEYIPTF